MMSSVDRALPSRKVDVRLPGKGNSNSHGSRPVHLIITMIKWVRTSRLSIKNYLCEQKISVHVKEATNTVQFTVRRHKLTSDR